MINKKINKYSIDVLAFLYFIVVLCLTFDKGHYSRINFNPLEAITQLQINFKRASIQLISNTLIYFPLGIYLSRKHITKGVLLSLSFIIYIFIIEFLQLITNRGVFDIDDIITNTLGFIIGLIIGKIITVLKKK